MKHPGKPKFKNIQRLWHLYHNPFSFYTSPPSPHIHTYQQHTTHTAQCYRNSTLGGYGREDNALSSQSSIKDCGISQRGTAFQYFSGPSSFLLQMLNSRKEQPRGQDSLSPPSSHSQDGRSTPGTAGQEYWAPGHFSLQLSYKAKFPCHASQPKKTRDFQLTTLLIKLAYWSQRPQSPLSAPEQ